MTHLLLNGGTKMIRDPQLFHAEYVKGLLDGVKFYYSEKRDYNFKFYLDFDYIGEELDFLSIFLLVFRIVDRGKCNVARAKERRVEKGTKYGFHLIWPEFVVNIKTAQEMRQKILNEFGDWSSMFDGYSSSLRMLWSYKDEPDSTCYIPWGLIQSGTFSEFTDVNPSVKFLDEFSIKTEQVEVSQVDTEVSLELNKLEKFIHQHFMGYDDVKLLRSNFTKNGIGIWISTNSRFCSNIKREHKSNHVYFEISIERGLIRQRCLDCECKEFRGRWYALPRSIKELCIHTNKCRK
jgi:hypothetical protein